jgi:ssDNA thymidine ADP-ribosyltransferase, DarT
MSSLTPERALVFRITHIDNVLWILSNGLHCRNSPSVDPHYREIGNRDLIDKRSHRVVPIAPGGTLSDYIPFYFTPYSPMLFNIKTGYNGMTKTPMSEIVILASSLHKIEAQGIKFVFTDRHAYLKKADDAFSSDLADLGRIDWKILQARDFTRNPDDPGKFERYQAEALVHQHMPISALTGLACNGSVQEARLRQLAQSLQLNITIASKPNWYL